MNTFPFGDNQSIPYYLISYFIWITQHGICAWLNTIRGGLENSISVIHLNCHKSSLSTHLVKLHSEVIVASLPNGALACDRTLCEPV